MAATGAAQGPLLLGLGLMGFEGCKAEGLGVNVLGLGFRVLGLGFRV